MGHNTSSSERGRGHAKPELLGSAEQRLRVVTTAVYYEGVTIQATPWPVEQEIARDDARRAEAANSQATNPEGANEVPVKAGNTALEAVVDAADNIDIQAPVQFDPRYYESIDGQEVVSIGEPGKSAQTIQFPARIDAERLADAA